MIKARERNLVYFTGSLFMIFTLNPIHQISQTYFIEQNIKQNVIFITFLLTPFAFLCLLLSLTKYE